MFSLGGDDDIFGQMDRMMNQMMGSMGGGFPHPDALHQQHQQLMQQAQSQHQDAINSMMMASPFGGAGGGPFGGFGGGLGGGGLSPFGGLNSLMFGGGLNNMLSMMHQQAGAAASSAAPGTFVQQNFLSIQHDGVNPPEVIEQTHMNRVGPGGVREERRTLRDSRSGRDQMSIGRHINERGHVIERSRNRHTGDREEKQEFINIEEEEAEQFQNEWCTRMGPGANVRPHTGSLHRYLGPSSHRAPLAITAGHDAASRSAAASPRHQPHHHQAANHHHHAHSSSHHRLSPPSPASTSSENGPRGGSVGSKKQSLRVKPVAMKKERKSSKKASSSHLPKE